MVVVGFQLWWWWLGGRLVEFRLVGHRLMGCRLGILGSGWFPVGESSRFRCRLGLIWILVVEPLFCISSVVDIVRYIVLYLLVSYLYYEES